MNIFVTGGGGFLGQHLLATLKAQGHTVVSPTSREADLRKPGALDGYAGKFDRIFHLAAWTQAGDFCLHHPGEQWIINQEMNTNVLSWWQRLQPQAKMISMGTSCAYAPDLELKEPYYLVGEPIESLFTYAMTKRMLYAGQLALQKQYGMRYLTLVPSTLYGSGYHTDGRQMHFIFDLIRKILRAKFYGEEVVLWGDGTQRREIVLVDDFIEAMLFLADSRENDLINIGSGIEYPIRHFAGLICEEVGYDAAKISYDTSRYVGAKSKCLDIDKLKGIHPGWTQTPLETGLRKTIGWFLDNKEKVLPPAS
ncbi:GDP-L-fucose synthase [Verrucomicrobium sp. GAS474]|uniref:NAD-dependent epimerase/dehydratase family protein n=1 Tax=Verrucomicrobium sp. GAS474 TaxID=1882831 RepID=UPI00087A837C|nr:NAD-dependent epimerase/dehydratase family protein [Verrucomicrobium sp. GAS474]SDU21370.1 GDP-L-fucose synthase [Verrucomicrobium sp. GAS474]